MLEPLVACPTGDNCLEKPQELSIFRAYLRVCDRRLGGCEFAHGAADWNVRRLQRHAPVRELPVGATLLFGRPIPALVTLRGASEGIQDDAWIATAGGGLLVPICGRSGRPSNEFKRIHATAKRRAIDIVNRLACSLGVETAAARSTKLRWLGAFSLVRLTTDQAYTSPTVRLPESCRVASNRSSGRQCVKWRGSTIGAPTLD